MIAECKQCLRDVKVHQKEVFEALVENYITTIEILLGGEAVSKKNLQKRFEDSLGKKIIQDKEEN